ncbi:hypothetical protein [Pontimicrobium sp. MEBiC01747]
MKRTLILILFILLNGCTSLKTSKILSNEQKLKVLQTELNLTNNEFNTLKNDDSIINQAYKTLKYKVNKLDINKNLDSFFAKKYTRHQTFVALILNRVTKDTPFYNINVEDNKGEKEPFTPEKERELRKFFIKQAQSFEKSGGQWVTDTSLINSRRRNEPDSIYRIKLKKHIKRKDSLYKAKMKIEDPERYYRLIELNRVRDSLIRLKQKDSLN